MSYAQDVAKNNTLVCIEDLPETVPIATPTLLDYNVLCVEEPSQLKYKVCKQCHIEKPIEDFSFTEQRRGNRCKICKSIQDKKRKIDLKIFIEKYLLEHPCVDCGEKYIIVLDFDHVKGKRKYCVPSMIGLKSAIKEISKCEVRCANCHRRRHYYERRKNGTTTS